VCEKDTFTVVGSKVTGGDASLKRLNASVAATTKCLPFSSIYVTPKSPELEPTGQAQLLQASWAFIGYATQTRHLRRWTQQSRFEIAESPTNSPKRTYVDQRGDLFKGFRHSSLETKQGVELQSQSGECNAMS
jgi:hypothetical protein